MKQHKKTDRIIREKMEQYSTETPMHLFDGIMNAVDTKGTAAPKQKSWKRGWLLSLLALIIVGSGTWYIFSEKENGNVASEKVTINLNEKNQNSNATTTISDKKIIDASSVISTEKTNSINQNSNTVVEFSNTISEISNTQNKSVNTALTQATSAVSNNQSVEALEYNKALANTSFPKTTPRKLENKNISIPNPSNSISKTTKDQLIEKGGSFENTISIPQKQKTTSTNTKNDAVENSSSASLIEKEIASNKNNKTITNRSSSKEPVLFLPDLRSTQQLSKNTKSYEINVEPRCGLKPDGSKIKFTTSVDAFFSPDYAVQMLEYKLEDFKHHAEMRNDSESPYYSFNTGIRVNFLTEFDWAIRTGIVYTQINDILKTTHKEILIQLNTAGDTLSYTEGTRDVNIRNRYKMVDIPVLIGYEVPMKKFTLNVNGGVYVNIKSKQSGAFFSPLEDKVVYFTEGHPDNYDIFRNNVGLSMFFSLGFNFDLGEKTQLIVEPHTRFYPKSFTVKNYILNQKYLSTGVMIGLRRDL